MCSETVRSPMPGGSLGGLVSGDRTPSRPRPKQWLHQEPPPHTQGIGEEENDQLLLARLDTGFGCVMTQVIMAAMLVTTAAVTSEGGGPAQRIGTVQDLFVVFVQVLPATVVTGRFWTTPTHLNCAVHFSPKRVSDAACL